MQQPKTSRRYDIVCIGRAAVDLYGEQLGSRLEDMQTFAKYLGGSSANIAYGAARLGLRVAMLTRVGDEHMGRFVREELRRGGVDVTHVRTDPARLTGMVLLAIKNRDTFPLLFYRENCADMALCEDDVDAQLINDARSVVITGTHMSTPTTHAACKKAMVLARAAHTHVILDIDYRPVLWGLTGRGDGEQRYVHSETVTAHLQAILPLCDVVVGTEEEIHIAGGNTDLVLALHQIRACTQAAIVIKHGAEGASMLQPDQPITTDSLAAARGPGFHVEVLNVLGAGDAFMAGFLSGWLRDAAPEACLRRGNACGAIVVTRHGCSPAMPARDELEMFLEHPEQSLDRMHWAATRQSKHQDVCILAFDHRRQLTEMAEQAGAPHARIPRLKACIAQAVQKATPLIGDKVQPGILVDDRFGQHVLEAHTGKALWIGRPVEQPASRPLAFECGEDVGLYVRTWPKEHVVKCLVWHHPDDAPELIAQQMATLRHVYQVCQKTEHVFLLEVIPPKDMHTDPTTASAPLLPRTMEQIYQHGIFPDWWKLPTPADGHDEWRAIDATLQRWDPACYGVLLLGLDAPMDAVTTALQQASQHAICKGFAVGRTLFAEAAKAWFANQLTDEALIEIVMQKYITLVDAWHRARAREQAQTQGAP